MSQALGTGTDHSAVLSRFVSGLSGRDARLLRRLLGGDPADRERGERDARAASVTGEGNGGRRMWLLYLPLVIPALAGAAARPLAARLEPRLATWLLTPAAVALAGCSTAALALLAAYAAARAPVAGRVGRLLPVGHSPR